MKRVAPYPVRPRGLAAAALALGLSLTTWSCAGAGQKPSPKVLLIGIDAGEWSVIGPLMDEGKLPNFQRLRDKGASGKLRSLVPLTKSPIIWASIATGKVPAKTGISDFFVKRAEAARAATGRRATEEESPTTSNFWRARPVWDILGSLGKSVGVVGWWTTWPATPVNGFLVSDYVQYANGSWPGRNSRWVYPDTLQPLVKKYHRTPESISWAELFKIVPPIDTTKVTKRQEQLVQPIRWIMAGDLTFEGVGLDLYKRYHPDFFTVYFRGVDEISHQYWDIDMPGFVKPNLSEAEYRWLKDVVRNYYIFTDKILGRFLAEMPKGTDVIVNSDHGFGGGGKGVLAHKVDGIVFAMGPGVPENGNISGATVLDITPTVLAMFGLPTAQDMDGRPIDDVLPEKVVKRLSHQRRLLTYETGKKRNANPQPIPSPVDQELRERLKSLGYIQ